MVDAMFDDSNLVRWLPMALLLIMLMGALSEQAALLTTAGRPCGPCTCFPVGPVVDCSDLFLPVPPSSQLPENATVLILRNNTIYTIHPDAFARFRRLHSLDLSQNDLSDLTANSFRGLHLLRLLNLSSNRLSLDGGRLFQVLSKLTHLDLSFNLLTDLRKAMGLPADCLRWLDLSNNAISSQGWLDSLWQLVHLTHLNLSHNLLTDLSGLLVGMNQLQELDLSFNQIPLSDTAYPREVFKEVGISLLHLRLEGNCKAESPNLCLKYPDGALASLSALKSLRMDGLPQANFGPGFRHLKSLRNLSLSGLDGALCSMNHLYNNTFDNFPPSVTVLNVSGCNISHIEPDVFRPFPQLETLDLSSNVDLGFETLGDAMYSLQGSALRALYINSIIRPYTMCVSVTPWNTRHFKNTSLETIHARNNRLEAFCEGALRNMPDSLRFVTLDQNDLGFGRYFKDFGSLKNLREIHNDGHRVAFEPPTEYPPDTHMQCSANSGGVGEHGMDCHRPWRPEDFTETVWTPDLRGEIRHRATAQPGKLVYTLPPMLTTYVSRWDKLYYKILDVEFDANNSLTVLNLSNNLMTMWIGPIVGLNKLIDLDLANNFAHIVSPSFFLSFPSLRIMNASRNNLRHVIERDKDGKLFQHMDTLEELYLSLNYINVIPQKFFRGLVGLRKLVLSHNEIFMFDVDISTMHNLTTIDLSYNAIRFLPQSVMDHLDRVAETTHEQVMVDMTFNPIACTCEHIDFLTWIHKRKEAFPETDSYTCLMSDGSTQKMTNIFEVIERLQNTCFDHSGILTGAVSCFICLMLVLAAALAFRFRWKLRYLYYASRLFYNRLDKDQSQDFQFDAFVSYSSENNDFVHGALQEELENGAGLRLNIHNRDFVPGRLIPSNIVHAVQNSRHTLVVLTRELLGSDWCHYELQMAVMEASYTGRDVLLFLVYEDMPGQELSKEMLYNLKSSTYITYPASGEPALVRDFWTRLATAIRQ